MELSAKISTREVFSCQAPIPEDIQEAMDALCVEVGEEPPLAYVMEGDLHPALMLHWRVQAYLVSQVDPSARREYRSLLPGLKINGRPLRAFTMSRGPPPRARRVVVEGWTPEVPQESRRGDGQGGGHSRGGRRGASSRIGGNRDPPDESQEDTWGDQPSLWIALGGDVDLRLWSTGAGSPPGA